MMSTTYEPSPFAEFRNPPAALHGNWLWLVLLGIALILFGFIALAAVSIASLATAVAIGALLLASGVAEFVGAFRCRDWSRFLLQLLSGMLSIVVGGLYLWAPVDALLALTLLLACMLMVGGVFKTVPALSYRFEAWGWSLLSGVIDFILGVMIWQDWPVSALWVIGLFVGISLLLRGFNWIGLGLALRALPRPGTA